MLILMLKKMMLYNLVVKDLMLILVLVLLSILCQKVWAIRKIHVQYLGRRQVSDIGELLMFSSSLLLAVSDFN